MALFVTWGMKLIGALGVMAAGYYGGKYIKKFFDNFKKLDKTLRTFLGGLAKYTIYVFAAVIVLGQFGVQTASLIAVLGAAGLAIGLALQGTLSNVAAGVMMLILRPFNVGDTIQFGSILGEVKTLGLFGCELSTPDNIYIYAPNSAIWSSDIYNYSRNNQRRQDIAVGISYDDDINKAFKTIEKVLKADPRLVTTKGKEPEVMVSGMGESSVDLKVRVWTKTSEYWDVQWDLTKNIKEALDKDGISIPFPTRTLINVGSAPAPKKAANKSGAKKAA
jgi:small conductance mechanosensitive channel